MALQPRNQHPQDTTRRGVDGGVRASGGSAARPAARSAAGRRSESSRTIGDFPPRQSAAGAETRDGPQRRRAARVHVGLPVQLRRRRDAQPTVSLCYDLAPNGMFIETSQPLRAGNVLRFECGYGPDCGFAGLARVMWVRGKIGGQGPQGVGVSFIGLDPRGEAVIWAILAEHGEAQPQPERDASVLPPPAVDPSPARTTDPGPPPAPGADKRRSARAALSLDMRYASDALRVPRDGICENLSASGMFLAVDEPLAVGTSVHLHCPVGVAAHAIEGTGRVLWRRTRAARDGRPAGMAIEFTRLSPESVDVIDEVLGTVGGRMPGPAPSTVTDAFPGARAALVPPPAPVAPVVAVTDPHIEPKRTISVDDFPAVAASHDDVYLDSPADAHEAWAGAEDVYAEEVHTEQAPEVAAPEVAEAELPPHRPQPMLREERLRELIAAHVEHVEHTASEPVTPPSPAPARKSRPVRASVPSVVVPSSLAQMGPVARLAFGGAILIIAWLIGRGISLLL